MEVIILLFGIVLFVVLSMYFSIVNHCMIMGMNILSLCFGLKVVNSDTIDTSCFLGEYFPIDVVVTGGSIPVVLGYIKGSDIWK